ncbi:MAG: carbohydrate kinase family protein [Candidatus Dependentiae bacterium]|nr:carbohydrate kinase family protein [Candidatus Dependentiae bacterium]
MKKIMTIGSAMRDMFLDNTQAQAMYLNTNQKKQSFIVLQEGKKIEVNGLSYHIGGGAINSAASFALIGHPVESFFKVGCDQEGDFVCAQMTKRGVITDTAIHDPNERTGTSIIIPCPSGDRAIFVHRGANKTLSQPEIPLNRIASCEQLYITSLSNQASQTLPFIVKEAKKHNIQIAVNPGTSQLTTNVHTLELSLPYIDIFILNSYEATLLMNALVYTKIQKQYASIKNNALPELLKGPIGFEAVCFTLRYFFTEIISRGPKIVIVTNGAEGVYAADNATIYFHPSIKTHTISTLGAGDAFGSTFVSYITQGKSIADALRAGAINAASVLGSVGAQEGLLTLDQLTERISALDLSLLQQFNLKN